MKDFYSDIQVGDTINIDGDSSFCTPSTAEVTEIKTKYDENDGHAYRVICCGSHEFHGESGLAMTTPTAYYISE